MDAQANLPGAAKDIGPDDLYIDFSIQLLSRNGQVLHTKGHVIFPEALHKEFLVSTRHELTGLLTTLCLNPTLMRFNLHIEELYADQQRKAERSDVSAEACHDDLGHPDQRWTAPGNTGPNTLWQQPADEPSERLPSRKAA